MLHQESGGTAALERFQPICCRRVFWTDGVTQGGSSGAALFDAETRKVVAVLSGEC